jgi:hypothetical protein
MKCLEIELAKIGMESLQWSESSRLGQCGARIDSVKSDLLSIMKTLERDLDEKTKA